MVKMTLLAVSYFGLYGPFVILDQFLPTSVKGVLAASMIILLWV